MRLRLSPPDVGPTEKAAVLAALDSGWVAPLGPEVDAFEADVSDFCDVPYAVALSSGTAALHLALLAIGVEPGDDVVVPTLTFGATAFAVSYVGARPVFVDSEPMSWNLDPDLLADHLAVSARRGTLPRAVIAVDLFGRTADYDRILPLCMEYEIPLMVDAAESLGSLHNGAAAGSMGVVGVFSFNGNKIITTSGGGMLVTHRADIANRARHLATQARQPVPWYEHQDVGYNYRMSNVLAALGRAQFRRLAAIIGRRRAIRGRYARRLDGVAGISVVMDPAWSVSNAWLTTILFGGDGTDPNRVRSLLEQVGIETRNVWKPMHMQPLYAASPVIGGSVAESLFSRGLCLPSGTRLADADVDDVARRIAEIVERPVSSSGGLDHVEYATSES